MRIQGDIDKLTTQFNQLQKQKRDCNAQHDKLNQEIDSNNKLKAQK